MSVVMPRRSSTGLGAMSVIRHRRLKMKQSSFGPSIMVSSGLRSVHLNGATTPVGSFSRLGAALQRGEQSNERVP